LLIGKEHKIFIEKTYCFVSSLKYFVSGLWSK
jgi:hypothetical protein